MTLGLKAKLYISFLLVILLPIGALVGFYFWSMQRIIDDTPTKLFSPYFSRKVASDIAQEYIYRGDLQEAAKVLEGLQLSPGMRIEVLDISGQVVADTAGKSIGNIVTLTEMSRLLSLDVFEPTEQTFFSRQQAVLTESGEKSGLTDIGIRFMSMFIPGPGVYTPIIEEGIKQTLLVASRAAARGEVLPARYYATVPINVGRADIGFLLISTPFPDISPLVGSMHQTILVGGVTALLLIFFLGWLLSSGIIHPLKALSKAAECISQGDFNARVTVKTQDALGKLADSFNHMAEKLQRSKEAEKLAMEARKEMIINVSHDLRTPLSAIRGYVEGLQDGIVSEPQKVKRYLEVLHSKAIYLERLINDLFWLAKLEAGQLEMNYVQVGATNFLNELSAKFAGDFHAAGIFFSSQIAADLPEIKVDKGRIEQVLNNLVANALSYTSAEGKVTLEVRLKGAEILVSLTDNGAGIEPADLPYIFDRFYRGDKARSSVKGGTGLGLSIARQIIEAHGGHIWVESTPGEGSSFTFTLPVILSKAK